MEKLAALVPPPRANQVRYHGFLAPNFRGRNLIAKSRKMLAEEERKSGISESEIPRKIRMSLAKLLKRTFNIDIKICPCCGGKRRILSAIIERREIRKILLHIGTDPDPPDISPSRYEQLVCGY